MQQQHPMNKGLTEVQNPSYAGTNYEIRPQESSLEDVKSPKIIPIMKTQGNFKMLKNSVDSISNVSVSRKPVQHQAKYEITGPVLTQKSIDSQNDQKRKTMFNHFEQKNEAIPVPQNGGKTPINNNGFSSKQGDKYKVPIKMRQSVAGAPNIGKNNEILPTIGKMIQVNRGYANSQINPSSNIVIQNDNRKSQLSTQMPFLQDPRNIPQNQALIDRYLREKELKLHMVGQGNQTQNITPKFSNMKKKSNLIPLQNAMMYNTIQMSNQSPSNPDRNQLLENYYNTSQQVQQQFINTKYNMYNKQKVVAQNLSREKNLNVQPLAPQNKIIIQQLSKPQIAPKKAPPKRICTEPKGSCNPNDPILITSHSALFQQDKQLSQRIEPEIIKKGQLPKIKSTVASPTGEQSPAEQNRSQLKQRRPSNMLEKQNFKNQFETFRTIYQGENRQVSRSAESVSECESPFKKTLNDQQSDGVTSPTNQRMENSKTQLRTSGGKHPSPKQIEEKKQNEEKVKQLKQFIYMVDLFNVMEKESKSQMSFTPENNINEKQQKLYNLMQEQISTQQDIIRKSSNSNIDQNMWKHFQNLLKKNQSNPYLKEAFQNKPQQLSQQEISKNFKEYLEDLQNGIQNGLIDNICQEDIKQIQHQNYQQKKQLNQLQHLMQNNSSFANLIDKNIIGQIKSPIQGVDLRNKNNTQIQQLQKGKTLDPFTMPPQSVFYNQSGNFQVGKTQATGDSRPPSQLPLMGLSSTSQDISNPNLASLQNYNRNAIIMQQRMSLSPQKIYSYPRPPGVSNIIVSGSPLGSTNFASTSQSILKSGLTQHCSPSQSKFQIPINPVQSQFNHLTQTHSVSPTPAMTQQIVHGHQVRQHQRSHYQYEQPQQESTQIPMQISSTLFIMDCQTFGILSNQKLLKIGPQSFVPGTSIPNSSSYQYSEAQMVNFVMSRAQTCSSTPFLELPKLSEESKRILNTIKAQQHLNMVHEIQKIDTLIIEMDYFDYKNQLLQQLFHQWGNKVLSNLVHRIETPKEAKKECFQTIHEYIDKIRKHHDDSIKLGNLQHQQLFSQINDFSSANEAEPFDSFEMKKSRSSSKKLAKRSSEELIPTEKIERVGSGKIEPKKSVEINEQAFVNELQLLFPKKYNKKNKVVSSSLSSSNYQEEKKLKKKINFHVMVKNTKLYEALKFVDQQNKIENSRAMLKKEAEENSKGPLSMYQLSSDLSHNLDLSSYILTKDCSILRFALYCAQVGIVHSAQQLLRQFFKNIYIVVKPGSKVMPDGGVVTLSELPKVDIDKINRYLVQSNMRKQMQNAQQKSGLKFSEMLPGQDIKNLGSKNELYATLKVKPRYELRNERDVMKKNYSLKSFKSIKIQDENDLYQHHFNSGPYNVGPIEKTKIKIIHKPYTHLDNSRIQKCFKIYNEFVQIVLKNRAILVTNQDSNPSNEFLKSDINKIYKLAYHMGIKLPKRSNNSSILGRSPLIETLKNHRQINQIKEQMIRFVHRILNEENGMSNNFIQCVIMGSNFQEGEHGKKSIFQDISEQPMSSIGQFVTSYNSYYKYQVGIGNNHQLIKSLMRQRLWWHHIQRDKNIPQQAVMKLDFDEAQIMWSQWRKVRLYQHLQSYKGFREEFQELIQVIDNGKLQITIADKKEKHNEKIVKLFVKKKSAKKSPKNSEDHYSDDQFEEIPHNDLKQKLDQCKKQIQKVYNRLEFNQHLNNKKALFINMRNYYTYCCENEDVFNTLPLTFNIKMGHDDPEFVKFQRYYEQEQIKCQQNKTRKNIWIIKPGENSNRGNGIKVEQDLNKIRSLVLSYCSGNGTRTMILQKYIDNPLLYQKRKFDIRCFSLVTCHNGTLKAYFYRDGYIRTSSKEYSHTNLQLHNKFIHLVNDAVQKYSEDYGKYESGNKLSYQEFQKYLTSTYPEKNINMERDIIMQIKKIVTDTIRATFHFLDSKKRLNTYELFGYDFMFDDEFKPFLIEVNSNPSLEPSSTLLTKLFTQMLDNTFRIGIDPLFPPTEGFSLKKGATGIEVCPENRFDLIFDERIDGPSLLKKIKNIGKQEMEEVDGINELSGSGDEHEEEVELEDD